MDLEKVSSALGGFTGGLVTGLLRSLIPSYADMCKRIADLENENRDLRAENLLLREKNAGLYDALEDET